MKVYYQDEYGADLFNGDSDVIPRVGETVVIDDEDFKVKDVWWTVQGNYVTVSVSQNQMKSKASDDVGDRLAEMQRAIVQVNKRQDTQERKAGHLKEQLVSVRTYLRTQRIEKK
jgi:hypothetical protein